MPRDFTTQTLYGATVITTNDQSSQSIEVGHFKEATLFIKVTEKVGTSPTIDFDLQASHDGTDWYKLADIAQISNPTLPFFADAVRFSDTIGRYIRLNPTVGGTSPSMTVTAIVILKD